jgi:hypothetical protein
MATTILYNGGVQVSYTDANNLVKGWNSVAYSGDNIQIVERTVDAANLPTGASKGIGDIFELFPIPPKTLILSVGLEVISADSTNPTATIALGDVTAGNAWVGATAMSSANATTGLFISTLTPKVFNGLDRIKATIATAALTNAVFRAFAVMVPIARADQNKQLNLT